MASEFLQMVVVVQLRSPPEQLYGSVTGVAAGQSLTLSNVWSYSQRQWLPQVTLDPANIVEITDASKDPNSSYMPPPLPSHGPAVIPASVPTPTQVSMPSSVSAPAISVKPTSSTPVLGDPAILSFKSRPAQLDSDTSQPPSTIQGRPSANDANGMPLPPHTVLSVRTRDESQGPTPVKFAQPPTIIEPNAEEPGGTGSSATTQRATRLQDGPPKTRHRQRQNRRARGNQPDESVDLTPERPKQTGKGKGWRETPMLEVSPSFQPFKSLKKNGRQRNQANQDFQWASDNANEVQEMGDFDFEESLAKFDKRTLFDQMRLEDQVDDADRLVTHNRKQAPKPGTAGGKNLHYSENVLDLPSSLAPPKSITKEPQTVSPDFWNSEADVAIAGTGAGGVPGGGSGPAGGGDRSSGRELGSRQSSRRGDSKVTATRRSQSRKASAGTVGQGPPRANPIATPTTISTTQSFYLLPSERRLETVSALQMLNLENIAQNELGLTEDMMAENAGRGIAEVALEVLNDPAIKIRTRQAEKPHSHHSNAPAPTIVVLAGNNKSGSRAVAGSRHLRNKGINVLLCVVGIERGERELLEDLRQQTRLYRNFGGRVYSKTDLFEHLRKATIPTLTIDTPRSAVSPKAPAVTLIIDALLGLAVAFDELRTGDQATVYELIEWANRNEAFVLAVDVPTGVDPSSGEVSIVDGAQLYVRPRYVVALGAPKRGLLEAMAAAEIGNPTAGDVIVAEDPAHDWRLFVADIGLGAAVWKKAGTKMRRGIDFDAKWMLEMGYQGLEMDDS